MGDNVGDYDADTTHSIVNQIMVAWVDSVTARFPPDWHNNPYHFLVVMSIICTLMQPIPLSNCGWLNMSVPRVSDAEYQGSGGDAIWGGLSCKALLEADVTGVGLRL